MRGKFEDLTGRKFGAWEVHSFSYFDKRGNAKFACQCSLCGYVYDVYALNLLSGTSTKCRRCAAIERIYGHAGAF